MARYLIDDISTVDERLGDGIGVPSALDMLSTSCDRMSDADVPPGADPATYMARLRTLSSFSASAATTYSDNPMEASARYAVARVETREMFAVLNAALGTGYRVP